MVKITNTDDEYDLSTLIELIETDYGSDNIYVAPNIYALLIQNEQNELVKTWIETEEMCKIELKQTYGHVP